MRCVARALLAAALLLPAPAAPAAAPEQAEVLAAVRRIEECYRRLGPFRATFAQHYASSTFGGQEQTRGTVHVSGGRMLWDYDEPKGQKGALDGTTWRLVVPRDREVHVRERDPKLADPLADLLSGKLDILGVFAVRAATDVTPAEGRVALDLLPREARDDIDLVTLEAEARTGVVRRVTAIDPLGNRLVYELGTPVAERALPDAAFVLPTPTGYVLTRD